MLQFPESLEKVLLPYVKAEFYRGTRREVFAERPFAEEDFRFFAKGVTKLSDLFTTERVDIDATYLNQPELRAAYLLYFLPINFGKISFALRQIPENFWKRPSLRILDLGCGPASGSFAAAERLKEKNPEAKVHWTWVDQNERVLQDAGKIWQAAGYDRDVQVIRSDLRRLRLSGSFDLIVLSHALNEWGAGSAERKSEWLGELLERHLAPGGVAAILEPALKRPTRDLMSLRDYLLTEQRFHVVAPCLHDRACPMLEFSRGDWCHFYIEWREPKFLQRFDTLVGNENRYLKVAYLILEKPGGEIRPQPKLFRVVSNRMATRGKIEVVLCGESAYLHVTRLDRERSEANSAIDQVKRGDLVEIPDSAPGTGEDKRLRVGKQDVIRIVS